MRSVLGSFVCAARRALSKTVARPQAIMQSHDGGPMRTPFLLLLALLLIAPLAHADSDDLSGGVLLVHAPPSLTYTASASWCDSTHLEDCEDQVTSIPTDSSKTVVWFILSAWSEEKSFTAVEFGLGDFDPESYLFSESGLCLDHAMALYHGDWPGPNTGVAIASNDDAWTGQLVPIFWAAGINYAVADTIPITENPATEHAGWVSGESRTTYDAECLGALGLARPGAVCCPSSMDGENQSQWEQGGQIGLDALTGAAMTPSTNNNPFEKIDIYNDRSASENALLHQSVYGYPASLTDTNLVVVRQTPGHFDTLAVMNSFAGNFTNILSEGGPGYAEYDVDPPRFATAIDLLAVAHNVFDCNGSWFPDTSFCDAGKPILRVTAGFDDHSTYSVMLSVHLNMRNFRSGMVCSEPWFFLAPSDGLSGKVWSGVPEGQNYYLYYDVHEIPLPPDRRNKRITTIRLDSQRETATCWPADPDGSDPFYASNHINGISVATDFEIISREGRRIVAQRPQDSLWVANMGGYRYNGEIIGAWGPIGQVGCVPNCLAIVEEYYGQSCDARRLNEYLQDNEGYERSTFGRVRSLTGQGVNDTLTLHVPLAISSADWPGRRLVVDRAPHGNPVAGIRIVSCSPAESTAIAVIERVFAGQNPVQLNDDAVLYARPLLPTIEEHWAGCTFELLEGDGVVGKVEQALADSCPVILSTYRASGANHSVVASGMKAHYSYAGAHRGTYSVDETIEGLDELLDFGNVFRRAIVARPAASRREENGTLLLSLAGPVVIRMFDPLGRGIRWDAERDDYSNSIPGSFAFHEWTPEDTLAWSVPPHWEIVECAAPEEGDYIVTVIGVGQGSFHMEVDNCSAQGGSACAEVSGGISPGGVRSYRISYSAAPGAPLITEEYWAGVPGPNESYVEMPCLLINPNPSRGDVDIWAALGSAQPVDLMVLDVTGRKIKDFHLEGSAEGEISVHWDLRDSRGATIAPGAYFVRLRAGERSVNRKLMILR